jgi:pyruvate dehydrogenase E2 component (dihydrolipoamide acetyltransferase)
LSNLKEIKIPDIGGAKDVDVIEVLVKAGDTVAVDQSLVTLEGDKATMEIPSPMAGTVKSVQIKVGDKVSQGSVILNLATTDKDTASTNETHPEEKAAEKTQPSAKSATPTPAKTTQENPPSLKEEAPAGLTHAGPAVRRMARELGIDLTQVAGSGEKNRILKEDVQQFVKTQLSRGTGGGGIMVSATPAIDFSQFGETEAKPLNRIKKLTGSNLHRSWVTVPHVTQFGQTDITELEVFREQQKAAAEKQGVKLTPLVFIMKAVVAALKAYPHFNASLDPSGEQLILKKYFNLGVAVDTPNGLVVPVVRDVDKKSLFVLAQELAQISSKARDKGLSVADMQGGCFTISSLGGIGGTAFTPIVNTPEVAILGVSKSSIQPVYQNNAFVPRLMLPLSLSYDHRVIDGADGARFMVYLSERLADIRTLLL